jgi:hypothetical protein
MYANVYNFSHPGLFIVACELIQTSKRNVWGILGICPRRWKLFLVSGTQIKAMCSSLNLR